MIKVIFEKSIDLRFAIKFAISPYTLGEMAMITREFIRLIRIKIKH